MKTHQKLFLLLAAFTAAAISTEAQEWTRFRGPNGTGISSAKTIPIEWTEGDYNWKTRLPGEGHSSPVLWGDRIFVNGADREGRRFVNICVDADSGEVLWQRGFPLGDYRLHQFNSYASGSCAVDAEQVYFVRQLNDRCFLTALTHDAEPVWEFDLGRFDSQHGSGYSPMIHGDLVILAYDQILPGRIVAIDRKSGSLVWEIPLKSGRADYSVPCLYPNQGGEPVLIFNTREDGILGVEPDSGEIAWRTDPVLSLRSVSSPVFVDDITIATCGSGGGGNYVVGIAPPASGRGKASVRYEIRRSAPYVPVPLAYQGLLFLWSDGGFVTCVEPSTGEEHFRERVGGNYFSSPVGIDGKIYNVNASGEVVVIRASKEFRVLARNEFNELTHATPAIANGTIFYRTFNHLISIGGPQAAASSN